ncbi:LRSAM1 [Bugula neritina]|uniref:LRSAM1 n=1 Tax=Bugula neritina TaxID=10212 RepID=A0A7J7J772_BUGNE|nr:LRSAM1 [Bugula neritina]
MKVVVVLVVLVVLVVVVGLSNPISSLESLTQRWDVKSMSCQTKLSIKSGYCKVLQKEALILHTNLLTSLTDNGNKLENLSHLIVLDIHANSLSKLPSTISHLVNLQVLNISHNALSSLPTEIRKLKKLQTFNVSDNKLSKLPNEVGELSSLRTLNMSGNKIQKLPVSLCHCTALDSLTLDAESMKYPDRSICSSGVDTVMKFLCREAGIEYVAPSTVVLPLLPSTPSASSAPNPAIAHLHPDNIQPELSSYEEMKRQRQQQNLLMEQESQQNSQHLTALLKSQQKKKVEQVASLVQENRDCENSISQLQQQKDEDRNRLYNLILEEDTKATELIDEIIKRNSESKEKEDLLQELEDERDRELAQITVLTEELAMLRKEEMMKAMRETLEEMKGFNVVLDKYLQGKQDTIRDAQRQFLKEDEQIGSTLTARGVEKQFAVEDLLHEEEYQRMALESLMKQRDEKHCQLTHDISSLEKQLARLTVVEMSNKMAQNKAKQEMLAEQREHLTKLLLELMEQRDLRAKEIARRMMEMEAAREDELADFWLAQLQRLLDRKPKSQIDRESNLEIAVKDILNMSEADDYISRFAQHKVSIETLKTLTDDDLRRIGVYEVGVRKAILKNTKIYLEKIGELSDQPHQETEEAGKTLPSAPSSSELVAKAKPSATRAPAQVLTHVTTECVICMDKQTGIVFLPCGHVCTCLDCSQPLYHCPMCRAEISQKIILES